MTTLTVDVLDPTGKKSGTAELPAEVFDVQANVPLIHQVVVAQLAAARQGTHATKTRGEVRGGGKKPYRQKGTGRARQGSTRAPQFAGGGVVHGPQPRDYSQRTPKKMKAAALRGALSDRARAGRVHVVDGFVDGDAPSTKDALAVLAAVTPRRHVLVVARPRRRRLVEVAAQRRPGAPARRGPAQHLRRAGQRRRGVHPGGARGVPRPAGRARRQGGRDRDRGVRARGGGVEVTELNKNPRDVLLAPVVSEKSYGLLDEGKYTFLVDPRANKTEIKIAVEQVFGVKVAGGQHDQPQGQGQAHPLRHGQAQGHQARDRHPARGRPIDIFGGPVG